jgi:hypothetical protein
MKEETHNYTESAISNPSNFPSLITNSRACSLSFPISPSRIASLTFSYKIPISRPGFNPKRAIISSPEIGG